jgi:hypothetical protein
MMRDSRCSISPMDLFSAATGNPYDVEVKVLNLVFLGSESGKQGTAIAVLII